MIRKVMRRNLVLIGGLAIILILVLLIINLRSDHPSNNQLQDGRGSSAGSDLANPAAVIPSGGEDNYRRPVPVGIIVPEVNTTLTKEQAKVIAVPTVVVPAAGQGGSDYRNFDIKGEGNIFTPSQITAYKGDKIHINLTAVDKDYDLVFPGNGMMIAAKKGETKSLEFQALFDGSFIYYCSVCGGPNSSANGQIIVVK